MHSPQILQIPMQNESESMLNIFLLQLLTPLHASWWPEYKGLMEISAWLSCERNITGLLLRRPSHKGVKQFVPPLAQNILWYDKNLSIWKDSWIREGPTSMITESFTLLQVLFVSWFHSWQKLSLQQYYTSFLILLTHNETHLFVLINVSMLAILGNG